MQLRTLFITLILAAGLSITPAHAQTVAPCEVYICMAGISGTGLSGGPACTPAIAMFFSIVVLDPYFDADATSAARQLYLSPGCPAASTATNAAILQAIINRWGKVP